MRASYRVVLTIKEGESAPTIDALGAALEVGTEGAPDEMGFGVVEQIVVDDAFEDVLGTLRSIAADDMTRESIIAVARRALEQYEERTTNVVTYQSSPEKEAEIAWFRENYGFTWEYPGFLQAPNTPGYHFTVGLELDSDVPFVVQVTTEEGAEVQLDQGYDCQTREEVIASLTRFKSERGI